MLIVLAGSGCGTSNGSAHMGRWEGIDIGEMDPVASFLIIDKGEHYVFDIEFADGSGSQYPATYEDGYFTIQMSGFAWSAFYDDSSGHLIINGKSFRKVN